jgi:hypothetical protein
VQTNAEVQVNNEAVIVTIFFSPYSVLYNTCDMKKDTSPGAIAISKLSKNNIKKLVAKKEYVKIACKKYNISNSTAIKHINRRLKALDTFKPPKEIEVPYVKQTKEPFSKNEWDYGQDIFVKKLTNSPIIPVYSELKEVVEYYKLAIMPYKK